MLYSMKKLRYFLHFFPCFPRLNRKMRFLRTLNFFRIFFDFFDFLGLRWLFGVDVTNHRAPHAITCHNMVPGSLAPHGSTRLHSSTWLLSSTWILDLTWNWSFYSTLDIEVKEELLTEHSCNTDAKVSFLGKALVHSTRLTWARKLRKKKHRLKL